MMTIIGAFVAAISIFLVPIALGNLIVHSLKKLFRYRRAQDDTYLGSYLSRDFSVGAIAIFGSMLIVKSIDSKIAAVDLLVFSYITATIAYVYLIVKTIRGLADEYKREDFIALDKALAIIHCLVLTVISQFVWKWKSGLNNSLDWDTFFHQMIVNNIINGKLDFVTSKISDSVRLDAYSSIFHTIIALPYDIFKPDILAFWWFAGFLQLFFMTITAFTVGSSIYGFVTDPETKSASYRKYIAGMITSAITALAFLSYLAYNPYFLIPQILTTTVAGNALATLLYKLNTVHTDSKYQKTALWLIPSLTFMVLNHYILGTYCALFLVTIYITHFAEHKFKNVHFAELSKYLSLLLLVLIPFVLRYFNLIELNPGESSYYLTDIAEKIQQMTIFYSYVWPILLALGLVKLIANKRQGSNIIITVFILIVASLIAPIPYNLKFLSFGSLVFHAIMAVGILSVIEYLAYHNNKTEGHFIESKLVWIICAGLTVGLLVNLTSNVIVYKQTPSYKDVYTHVSDNEVAAAKYIKENYSGTNTLLLSDPATMFILEALSGINSPGGAYADENTRKILAGIYFSRDPSTTPQQLSSIKDAVTGQADTYLLVLSHRYFEWLSNGDEQLFAYYYNVWQPIDLKVKDYDFIDYLSSQASLKVVYKNEGLVVFEVKR